MAMVYFYYTQLWEVSAVELINHWLPPFHLVRYSFWLSIRRSIIAETLLG